MSDVKSFLHVGKVLSPQGVRGDVFVYIFAGEAAWSDQWKTLYLSSESDSEPQREIEIVKIKPHRKQKKLGFVLNLKNFVNRNQSEEIKGMKVYVPEDFLVSQEGEGIYLREVLDFKVLDKERGLVGVVVGFGDNGMQDLLVIENSKGESFEVPFVEPLHIETFMDKEEIHMDIPFGLIPGEEL